MEELNLHKKLRQQTKILFRSVPSICDILPEKGKPFQVTYVSSKKDGFIDISLHGKKKMVVKNIPYRQAKEYLELVREFEYEQRQ